MKKNGEYVGVEEKDIPEDEKYVDESLLGNREESTRKIKKTAKSIAIGYILFVIFIFAMFIGIAIFMFSTFNKTRKSMMDDFNQKSTTMREDYNSQVNNMMDDFNSESDKYNVSSFNSGLKSMQGTQSKFMLSSYLDKVVTSNKTNSNHIITVTYNETITTSEDGIVGIKHFLNDNSKYEVSLDYDANGYINKVTIKDI